MVWLCLVCPDLQIVCEAIVDDKLLQPLYESPSGPIAPIDILFGYRPSIAMGNEYMAHKGGFTYSVLNDAFLEAGFKMNHGGRNPRTSGSCLLFHLNKKNLKKK